MFLSNDSPRRSSSIPININLHGARRRQTRQGEVLHTAVAQEQDWNGGVGGRGTQGPRTQMPVSSVGEDRAILLGFTMMAFSVLMFFVVGITEVKPYVNSKWEESPSCVLHHTNIPEEWVDCRGMSTTPCLRVTVNSNGSNQETILHYEEDSVLLTTECFFIPKCHMDRKALQDEVQKVKNILDNELGRNITCFADGEGHTDHVILNKKYTLKRVLFALLWPCLLLGGGALLVGLVRLTQCLAHLSTEVSSDCRPKYSQGKLYKLLRKSSSQSPL
ncbi:calcium-activated potassium channel subunit beta-3 [Pholidichthys leucotaenia]